MKIFLYSSSVYSCHLFLISSASNRSIPFCPLLCFYSSLNFSANTCNFAGFPGGASGKEPACQFRRHGFDLWIGKVAWRKKWQPTPVFLPGESHGQRSLEGYSPWGCEESDMAEVTEHNCSHHLCPYVTIRGNACFLKCAGPPSCQWE